MFRIVAAAAALALSTAPRADAQTAPVTAFVDVNVVPMDAERVLPHQTVIVRDGKVAALGRALTPPADARIVDGHGQLFLSPGLADMHNHADSLSEMQVYLANGVTTVLNMGGANAGFVSRIRPAMNAGKFAGPHVYVAFLVDGSPRYGHFFVTTPDEARWAVRLAKTNGYDFIKVYNLLSPECFLALVDEGRKLGLPVVGHGVDSVGLERQLDAGQVLVAHTEEFLYTTFATPNAAPDAAPDPAKIPAAIAFVLRDKAFVTADLNTYATIARQWGKPAVADGFLQAPESRYVAPQWRSAWRNNDYTKRQGDLSARLAFLGRFTKAMSAAGVPLVTGTDAPIPGLAPGFSLHDDLAALEKAGLSRYQVLSAATRTPGEFIRRTHPESQPFGTVAVGARADLILSSSNPLNDLGTLRSPLGVMSGGQWHDRTELQALLAKVAATYTDGASAH